jgi:hypothetical protein
VKIEMPPPDKMAVEQGRTRRLPVLTGERLHGGGSNVTGAAQWLRPAIP